MKNFKILLFSSFLLSVFVFLPTIVKAETSATPQQNFFIVTYPNGGEVFNAGDKINIKWTSTGISEDAKVVVFLESYQNKERIHSTSLSRGEIINDGEETLSLVDFVGVEFSDTDWPAGKYYKIFVGTVYPMIKDYSDNLFTINAKTAKKINSSSNESGNFIQKDSNKNLTVKSQNNLPTEEVSIQKTTIPISTSTTLSTIPVKKLSIWQRIFRFFFR